MLRKIHDRLKAPRKRAAARAFSAVEFGPGDIAIDCGAHVGEVTADLVSRGAFVYAFEPHPLAFAELDRRFGDHPRVRLFRRGVSDRPGTARLYLHRRASRRPLGRSYAASLLPEKRNLDPEEFVEIEVVCLSEFVLELERRVRLLKMDIEGAEYEVIHRLIDTGAIDRIDHLFCETHELKGPGLTRKTRRLRERLEREGLSQVDLDWR